MNSIFFPDRDSAVRYLLILSFLIAPVLLCAQDFHSKIKAAVESRDYQSAISELQTLARDDKNLFALNNYDYLLARLAEKQGDYAQAAANYQAVASRKSVLSEYALKHLAEIARASGNLILERMYLQQLAPRAPESLLKNAAHARLARSFYESADYGAAIASLQNLAPAPRVANSRVNSPAPLVVASNAFGNLTGNDAKTRENLVLLGQAFLRAGEISKAREIFVKLVTQLPNGAQPDDYALAGARGLDELDGRRENFGRAAPVIPDPEHLRRALIYQFNRSFSLARLHYAAIVERYPNSPNVPDALYQIGRGYVLESNFNEAVPWFERVQAEHPAHPLAKDALSQTASAYARAGKPKEALARYKLFIEKYPDAENLDRAYLNIIDVLRDTGAKRDALAQAQKTRETFRGKTPEVIAAFAQARVYIAQNDWANALGALSELESFADLGGARAPGGTNQVEIAFLKACAFENLARYAQAIDVYLSIPDGRAEYYGARATERLRALAANEKSKSFVAGKLDSLLGEIKTMDANGAEVSVLNARLQSIYRLTDDADLRAAMLRRLKENYARLAAQNQPGYKIPNFKLLEFGRREVLREARPNSPNRHQNLADELLFLGLYDEATPELETWLKNGSPTALAGDTAYTLAVFYQRGEMANRAVAFAEPLWRGVAADYQTELIPRDHLELLYPAPYPDALLKYAPERNVDPRLILAIMRQESRYRADVKSYAAARGLMQFISDTSNRIAGELNRPNFDQDELYHPPTAILFGAQYLSNLFRQFPNEAAAVAASYNGGENNMARWMARAGSSDADRYVPEIVFTQSKDYVYKVMANYRVYQMIYDEKLKAR